MLNISDHATNLVQDRISKMCNLLPIVRNPKKIGIIAHDDQQQDMLKYILRAAIPFKRQTRIINLFVMKPGT